MNCYLVNKIGDQTEKDQLRVQSSEDNVPLSINSNNILSSNVNNDNPAKIVELSSKETLTENNSMEIENGKIKDNENDISTLNNCSVELNDQMNECFQSIEEDKNEIHLLENKQNQSINEENGLLNKKNLKRNRRRRINSFYSNKRRRKQKSKMNLNQKKSLLDDQLFWMKKYSIESFTILVNRYHLPSD
jgi:hypothetical protein